MVKKLISIITLAFFISLFSFPAMAGVVIQVEPTAINNASISTSLRTLYVYANDVIEFQIVGYIDDADPGATDCGVNRIRGSLGQALATVTKGTWNTEVKGILSTVTLTSEFTYDNQSKPGVANQDVNNDGFALDIGSSGSNPNFNYIVAQYSPLTGHGANADVIGTFSYTVTDVNTSRTIPTSLNWLFPTIGMLSERAIWEENGTLWNSSSSTAYTAGTAIQLCTIPEPAVIYLLGIGISGLLVFKWRRRKQSE
jgi:hypothetical protein